MASGDTLIQWSALANEPPSTIYATFDTRNQHPILDFDPTADEEAVFSGVLPRHYAGGGFTVYVHYSMSTASGAATTVVWQVGIERVGDEQLDIDGDSFAAFQSSGADTIPNLSGEVGIATVVLTDGAQIDSVAVGEKFRLKVRGDADDTSATWDATGDAELHLVEIKET